MGARGHWWLSFEQTAAIMLSTPVKGKRYSFFASDYVTNG